MDETDRYVDNLRLQRVNAALLTSRLPKHLRKCAPHVPCLISSSPKPSIEMPAFYAQRPLTLSTQLPCQHVWWQCMPQPGHVLCLEVRTGLFA